MRARVTIDALRLGRFLAFPLTSDG